jgi:putative transposase
VESQYGGLEVSELVRVKELEAENSQLKRMYANLALENEAIKGGFKKAVAPSERRDMASRLAQDQRLSVRRSCQLVNLSRVA